MAKRNWRVIPPRTVCQASGCQSLATDTHHMLRVDPLHGSPRRGVIAVRNQPHNLQRLCNSHHLKEHELYESSGKWPPGLGYLHAPFRI